MANKNFTQFGLSSYASPTDFIVGYSQAGNQELRYNASDIRNTTYALSLLTGGNFDFKINGINIGTGDSYSSTNVAIGRDALNGVSYNTMGSCVVIGYTTGQYTSASNYGVYIGSYAAQNFPGSISSDYNVAIGYGALQDAKGVCVSNIGIGRYALSKIVGAKNNVIIGDFQGYYLTGGNDNTFVGDSAGSIVYTSNQTTLIGKYAGLADNPRINCSVLGYNANTTANNQVQLGNSSTTTYAYGAVQNRSDIRDKADVRNTTLGLDFIMALRPVDFKWDLREDYKTTPPEAPSPEATEEEIKNYKLQVEQWTQSNNISNLIHDGTHKRTRYHHGLIAQEVKQVLDDKGIDFGGYQDHSIKGGNDVKSIGYNELVAPLIKALQELKQEFDDYKASHP